MEDNARVYHIWQDTNGLQHYMMGYELSPRLLQLGGWSLGEPYDQGDIWTKNRSADAWFQELQQSYDYVMVAKADDQFWRRYGALFQGADFDDSPQVFKVTRDGLVRVP